MKGNGTKTLGAPKNRLPAEPPEGTVLVRPPQKAIFRIRLVGMTPLVVSNFETKMEEMEKRQAGTGAKRKKDPKVAANEWQRARYQLAGGLDGVKALSVKRALEMAAADDDTVTKTNLKWQVFVFSQDFFDRQQEAEAKGKFLEDREGCDLLPIMNPNTGRPYGGGLGSKDAPEVYTAMARVGPQKTADVRHRPRFWPWAVDVVIRYRSDRYTQEALCNLLLKAGDVGIGEERPSAPKASGQNGMFTIREVPKE